MEGMFNVILHQPEIPPNTGNVIRLCANTGAQLQVHANLDAALAVIAATQGALPRLFALSTRGTVRHDTPGYRAGDAFLFGAETRGLPADVLDAVPPTQRLRLPMRPDNRSLNLSNAVAVVVFEAWRQLGFAGSA
jgi:tRNA (cytidine/uridine-2'-O-)-methyltransferase